MADERRSPHPTQYRRDIDGLRAVAVLAVLGFHADVKGFQAGFAGVDVFFVISGYLISGIIFNSLNAGTFRYRDFYTRRINRLFPALLVVLFATLLLGWIFFYPLEMATLARQVVAGTAFISNFVLWGEAGYFDSTAKPLLHLWSLAVEEQFYLAFPAIAVFAWKRRWNIRWLLIAIIEISFVANIWAVRHGQTSAAFYFPLPRFWEILAGALLCEVQLNGTGFSQPVERFLLPAREVAAWAGVAILTTTALIVDQDLLWPGWYALAPVCGTLLLLASGPSARANERILSSRLLVSIGLISYPLYLWHWPLLVFARIINDGNVVPISWRIVILAASFLLAWATYRFVEKPVRFGRNKPRRAATMLPLLGVVAMIAIVFANRVLGPRIGKSASLSAEAAATDWEFPSSGGFVRGTNGIVVHEIPGDTLRTVVFLGDSHSQQYWPRIVQQVARSRRPHGRVRFITYGGCPLLPQVNQTRIAYHGGHFRCPEFYGRAMWVVRQPDVKVVVLAGWWETQMDGGYNPGDGHLKPGLVSSYAGRDDPLDLLQKDVAVLTSAGKHVFIVLSYPSGPAFLPASILPSRIPFRSRSHVTSVSRKDFVRETEGTMVRLRQIAASTGATVIDPIDGLCTSDVCPTVGLDGLPMYKDSDHFRASFAKRFLSYIDIVLDWEKEKITVPLKSAIPC